MSKSNRASRLPVLAPAVPVLLLWSAGAAASDRPVQLEEVVITAARMQTPLTIETDPRAPRQPVPAHDGADYLKTVPGFSVIRKGGTDGDPVFRGMAASRVNILLDGEHVLGGCGGRMDPPTAYVFPEAYDRIVVIKGPQTVLHGPGNSAATVLFDRTAPRFDEPGYQGLFSVLGASASRTDLVGDVQAGTSLFYGRLTATRAESDDYADGDGTDVHSSYMRWSADAAFGWTPNEDTLMEVTAARSDGEAAYADRAMDGVKFAREKAGLRFERKNLSPLVRRLEAQAWYNYVDHVMDNFSLRSFAPSAMMPGPAANNPDRRTTGGRMAVDLVSASGIQATVGLDAQENRHSMRSTMNASAMPFESMARVPDARFRNAGAFGEATFPLSERDRIVSGIRADRWEASDMRSTLALGMTRVTNPTAGAERDATLIGGFARAEHDLRTVPATFYAGAGRVERFPDYWELVSAGKESVTSPSAFFTRPERTTQLDTGWVFRSARLAFSLSAFYSDVSDYILIETGYPKGMRTATVVRNVDATTLGGELDGTFSLTENWKLTGTLAYTRGENDTDGTPLAQMPPIEMRAGLQYNDARWSAGLLTRVVGAQNRIALNQGNVVGQDLGPTGGFTIVSLHGGWRPTASTLVTAGIDNLFDRTYAEHLSRGGAMVSGFEQTVRVNEPGRTGWLKLSVQLD